MSDTRAPGWIWANMPHITAAAALCVIVAGAFTWMFGGFQPQSQIMQERLAKAEARLDTMPRPKDFSDWEGHLHDLDGKYEALKQKSADTEYNIRDLTNKYGGLTTSAARK